ncbi:hypothetical protein [Nostoc sp.]|uniref:hypothetical protein n=1 Tax=Nostoc sp. TaxID=1180 RepID=UPI002FF7D4DA
MLKPKSSNIPKPTRYQNAAIDYYTVLINYSAPTIELCVDNFRTFGLTMVKYIADVVAIAKKRRTLSHHYTH